MTCALAAAAWATTESVTLISAECQRVMLCSLVKCGPLDIVIDKHCATHRSGNSCTSQGVSADLSAFKVYSRLEVATSTHKPTAQHAIPCSCAPSPASPASLIYKKVCPWCAVCADKAYSRSEVCELRRRRRHRDGASTRFSSSCRQERRTHTRASQCARQSAILCNYQRGVTYAVVSAWRQEPESPERQK